MPPPGRNCVCLFVYLRQPTDVKPVKPHVECLRGLFTDQSNGKARSVCCVPPGFHQAQMAGWNMFPSQRTRKSQLLLSSKKVNFH